MLRTQHRMFSCLRFMQIKKNSQSTKEPIISMQAVHYSTALNFNTLKVTDISERFIIRSCAEYLGPIQLKSTKKNWKN